MEQEIKVEMLLLPQRSHNTIVDASREMAEVKVQVMLAMENPRIRSACVAEIIEYCQGYDFAKEALFMIQRGGTKISDGSVKLALVMAQNWGHLDYGVKELERRDDESVIESYCWDLQKNVRQRRRFAVPHRMKANGQIKLITDPNDIYFHVANMGARRMRSCIFDVIPADVKQRAIAEVKKTMARGPLSPDGKTYQTITQRIQQMVLSFKAVGVSVEMIEQRVGHKVDLTTGEELVEMQAVLNSIKDGTPRKKFFKFDGGDDDAGDGKAAELKSKLRGAPKDPAPPAPPPPASESAAEYPYPLPDDDDDDDQTEEA